MPEQSYVISDSEIDYEGIFSIVDLQNKIDNWLSKHKYGKREIYRKEAIEKLGRDIKFTLQASKPLTDYASSVIKIRVIISHVKNVDVKKGEYNENLNQGKLKIIFDANVLTDFENRWEHKGSLIFLRTVIEKYLIKPWMMDPSATIAKDCNELKHEIRELLKTYVPEEENLNIP